jgi:hypothetical protein
MSGGDDTIFSNPFGPSTIIGEPWIPNHITPYSPALVPSPFVHPQPLPSFVSVPPSQAQITSWKSDGERITEYRFLIKAIRGLVNAGKVEPATALAAIDAMLMALDDEYDKMDAQARK